jgi:hypothetical protein
MTRRFYWAHEETSYVAGKKDSPDGIEVKQIIRNRFLLGVTGAVFLSLCMSPGISGERDPDGHEFEGVIIGLARVSVPPGPGERDSTFPPVANVKIYLTDDAQLLAGGSDPGTIAFSGANGRFTLWDLSRGGGRRKLTGVWSPAEGGSITAQVTVYEVTGPRYNPDFLPLANKFRQSHNVGSVNIGFSSPFPVPAP